MATSQNGYKANDSSLVASYVVARDVKVTVRKGDVSVVLLHFSRWYDQHIEPLTKADTGGYNPRTIEGSKTLSNHASGTAVDLRWNKHALGKKDTFTAGQKAKITEQLKFYEGVIRWGENYKSKVDGMHYEINKAPAEVARIAKKIKASELPKPTTPTKPEEPKLPIWQTDPLEVDGVLGPKTIKRWQTIVKHKTVTDKMDDDFVKAIQLYLRRVNHRLAIDGDLGPKTIAALQKYLGSPLDGFITEPRSNMVVALQRRLNEGRF